MSANRPVGTLGISIVIPCLNEAETIAKAVAEARRGVEESGWPGEVVVADNGSTDGSQAIATAGGARVVPVPARGYGAALNAGILSARYACVVFGDADMSYPFLEAKKLAKPILEGQADFVLGSRLGGTIAPGAMPFLNRHLGTPVLSFLIRRLFGMPTSNCNSGMRALARARYPELKLNCPGMEYASEMLVRACLSKWRYAEAPISFRKDLRSRH
jgi:glycosyltransferase involved in cell wall biosynthesis